MTNVTKVVKAGQMPGRIVEVVVEVGSTVGQVLEIAGLDATGYEIKMDGVAVQSTDVITEATNLILLVKLVKGNAERLVKLGQMPGRIVEIAVDSESTIGEALTLAGLDPSGYEIKKDGTPTTADAKVGEASLILLVKQVKGNAKR
jgi:uncharacterized UPF0146 family protein